MTFVTQTIHEGIRYLVLFEYKHTYIRRQKHHKKGRDQVIDSLDITTGRMADSPDVQNSLKYL